MPAPPNYVFTIFAFICFFLCLIRSPMQLHAWNVGTLLFLVWVGLQCLFLGINSIIWNHNMVNWAPVWCDITVRFSVGVSVAIPAAILCINRRLYLLASPTSVIPSQAVKRREVMVDLAIGIGLPIMEMILFFFSQNHRFVIVEDYGCAPGNLWTWVGLLLYLPPIILEFIAGVYGCLSIRAFYKRRSQMNDILSCHQNLSSNRYLRLMCFSICDLVVGVPFTVFYLYIVVASGLLHFPGLKQEHEHLSEIFQVPAALWRATPISEVSWEMNRWIMVWGVFVFFSIFGFTEESFNHYRAALRPVLQVFRTMTGIKSRPKEEITFKAASRHPVDTMASDPESSLVATNTPQINIPR